MSGLLTRASEYLDDKWRKANTVGLAAQSLLNHPGLPNGGLDPVLVSSQDGADFLKGRAVGGLTAGADLMSMATPNSGANFLLGSGMGVSGGQREDLANQLMETSRQGFPQTEPLVSGDPIRRLAGLDPKSTAGLLGEMTSNPEAALAKGGKFVSGLLSSAMDRAPEIGEAASKGLLAAQAAFHGSKVGRFDTVPKGTTTNNIRDLFDEQYIGDPTKGEGATAYGHGLYFAEDPGVAGSYQINLSKRNTVYEKDGVGSNASGLYKDINHAILSRSPATSNQGHILTNRIIEGLDEGDSAADYRKFLEKNRDGMADMESWEVDGLIEGLKEAEKYKVIKNKGHFYEIDIPDETIGKMLDWDAPLSEQPESVRRVAKDYIDAQKASGQQLIPSVVQEFEDGTITGQRLYRMFGENGDEAASRALNEAGIPGIRFYDGASRNTAGGRIMGVEKTGGKFKAKIEIPNNTRLQGSPQTITWSKPYDTEAEALAWANKKIDTGTRNIVVFNPDDIRQVNRDGEIVFESGQGLLGGNK